MWGYYGSKSNIINRYPPAGNDFIIEPFAGTARYALRYWNRKVLIVDRYPELIEIWKWLQSCSDQEIERIPHFVDPGTMVDDLNFDSRPAKLLFSFLCGYASITPRNKVSDLKAKTRPNSINYSLNRIQRDRHKIKHWDIQCDDYRNIKNNHATWFIDPPYQVAGYVYKYGNNLNYNELAGWCLSRKGEIIVCEGPGANWLPFENFTFNHGARGSSKELIFHAVQQPGKYWVPTQLKLFTNE